MVTCLIGTPWQPDFAGKILFLEESGERPYRVLRMLTQLRLAGVFEKVSGIILGSFHGCTHSQGPSVEEIFAALFSSATYPVLHGVPFGHADLNLPIPIGGRARLREGGVDISV